MTSSSTVERLPASSWNRKPGKRQRAKGQRTVPSSSLWPAASSLHVVGIGINCHQTPDSFPPELREAATSLDLVGWMRCQRVTVAKRVLTSLDHGLRIAERPAQQVIDTWSRLSTPTGPASHPVLQQNAASPATASAWTRKRA